MDWQWVVDLDDDSDGDSISEIFQGCSISSSNEPDTWSRVWPLDGCVSPYATLPSQTQNLFACDETPEDVYMGAWKGKWWCCQRPWCRFTSSIDCKEDFCPDCIEREKDPATRQGLVENTGDALPDGTIPLQNKVSKKNAGTLGNKRGPVFTRNHLGKRVRIEFDGGNGKTEKYNKIVYEGQVTVFDGYNGMNEVYECRDLGGKKNPEQKLVLGWTEPLLEGILVGVSSTKCSIKTDDDQVHHLTRNPRMQDGHTDEVPPGRPANWDKKPWRFPPKPPPSPYTGTVEGSDYEMIDGTREDGAKPLGDERKNRLAQREGAAAASSKAIPVLSVEPVVEEEATPVVHSTIYTLYRHATTPTQQTEILNVTSLDMLMDRARTSPAFVPSLLDGFWFQFLNKDIYTEERFKQHHGKDPRLFLHIVEPGEVVAPPPSLAAAPPPPPQRLDGEGSDVDGLFLSPLVSTVAGASAPIAPVPPLSPIGSPMNTTAAAAATDNDEPTFSLEELAAEAEAGWHDDDFHDTDEEDDGLPPPDVLEKMMDAPEGEEAMKEVADDVVANMPEWAVDLLAEEGETLTLADGSQLQLGDNGLQEYLDQDDDMKQYVDYMKPELAEKYNLPTFTVFDDNFLNSTDYDRERIANIFKNKVKLAELDLEVFDPRFIGGTPPFRPPPAKRQKRPPSGKEPLMSREQREVVRLRREKEAEEEAERTRRKRERARDEAATKAKAKQREQQLIDDEIDRLDKQEERERKRQSKETTARRPREKKEEVVKLSTQEKKEQEKNEYETLWWKLEGKMPYGMAKHPSSTATEPKPIYFVDLPEKLRKLFEDHVAALKRHEDRLPLTGENYYMYVSPQFNKKPDPNDPTKMVSVFAGWQTQLSITGPNSHRIGVTQEARLGALLASVALVDPRLRFPASVMAWLVTMIYGSSLQNLSADQALEAWVHQVGENTIRESVRHSRSGGGRKRKADDQRASPLLQQGSSSSDPLPPMPSSSSDPLPMPEGFGDYVPPQLEDIESLAQATGLGLGESSNLLSMHDGNVDAAASSLLEDEDDRMVVQDDFATGSEEGLDDMTLLVEMHNQPTDVALARRLVDMGATVGQLVENEFPIRVLISAGFTLGDILKGSTPSVRMLLDSDLSPVLWHHIFTKEELEYEGVMPDDYKEK